MAEQDLPQINKGIKRLVKLIETSTIVDKSAISEMKKTRDFAERERDEKGRFVKKEKEIQDKKADTAEKEVGFIKGAIKQLREKNKKDWESFKEQSRLWKMGQAFWKSEAGMAIRNFFSRVRGILSNILGEIGEFFGNLWATLKDSFQFVKGTFGSIIDAFRGGDAKERREKKMAKDVENIRQTVRREERRGIFRRGRRKGKGNWLGDLLHFLGFGFAAGGGGIISAITGFLSTLLFKWIPWLAILKAVTKGIMTWIETGSFTEGLKVALKDLLSIPKWLVKTMLAGIDFFFGTDLKTGFEEGWKEFEKMVDEIVDFLFVTIPKAFSAAWSEIKQGNIKDALKAFNATLAGSDWSKRTMEDAKSHQQKIDEAISSGTLHEKMEKLRSLGEDEEDIASFLVSEAAKTAEANKERQTQTTWLERIAKALENYEGAAEKAGNVPMYPNTTGTGNPTIAPNVNEQLRDLTVPAGP